jgi:arginyl-tRNA synthetase
MIIKMDDGKTVYGVLKKFYEHKEDRMGAKSLCEEDKYARGESTLQKVGKKQTIYSIIHRLNVLNLSVLVSEAEREEISSHELEGIIADLKSRGLIYEPEPGFLGCAGD